VFSDARKEPVCGTRLGFRDIGNNGNRHEINLESQYFVDVIDTTERRVMFAFTNAEPGPSLITDIIFHCGRPVRIAVQVIADADAAANDSYNDAESNLVARCVPGVQYDPGTAQCVRQIHEGPVSRTVRDGIKYGETLGIVFDMQAGIALPDIISALCNDTFTIGIKVQGDSPDDGRLLINDPELHLPSPLNATKCPLSS
jgi:hypothetical protein